MSDGGSSSAGNHFSYGSAGATDRALGSMAASNTSRFYGWRLKNNTGAAITSLTISYTGEQWRVNNTTAQTLAFGYLTGTGPLTDVTSTAFTAVSALNFVSPVLSSTAAALDGNAAANRRAISSTITGLSIADGDEIFIRWAEVRASTTDQGLAVDDVTVSFTTGAATCVAPSAVSVGSVGSTTASVSFTGDATVTGGYTVTATPTTGTAVTATGSASPISLTTLAANTTYSVTVSGNCGTNGTATSTPPVTFTTQITPINIAAVNTAYTQNFDGLASTSTGDKTTLPTGFDFVETGTAADGTYTAGTGSSGTGDTYSFGSTGSTDRAFGTLQSGSVVPTIGAAYVNNSGATITSLLISYTGEQWRLGATNRVDQLDFQYSTTATGISSGTFTDFDPLDFVAPITTGSTGTLNGNLAANQSAVSATITGLSIPVGATFYIRWSDFNASGSDDGLGIDGFSLTANPVVTCAAPTALSATAVTASSATVTFTGSGSATSYTVTTVPVTTTQTLAAGATSVSFSNLSPSTAYTVNIVSNCAGGTTSSAASTMFTTTAAPCAAPTGLISANVTSTSADVNFTGSGSATSYTVTTVPVTTTQTLAAGATSVSFTGLTAGTAYTVNIVSNCAGGATSSAATTTFTTTAAATLQPISIAAVNTAYTENFDGLVNSGTGNKTTLPTGFDFVETGTNADGTYTAGTGSSSGGDTYSFGSSTAFGSAPVTDRAFGGVQSSALIPTIGAAYVNNSGATITDLLISYTGEQWRMGSTGRADRLDFQYSTTATGISTASGTFIDFDPLDYVAPTSTATGQVDGNLAANRTAVSATITGLSIPVGATFYIRWSDFNASGSDDGLGVDDFSLIANPAVTCAAPTVPTATGVTNSTATVNFTGSSSAVNGYTVTTVPATSTQTLAAGATSVSFTNLSAGTAYTVNIVSNCAGGATSSAATTNFTTTSVCNAPTFLAASAITTTSATVTFTGSGSATSYTVTTVPVTTTQTLAAGATSVSFTGLTAGTAYTVNIVSNCAGGATSSAATTTFTTTAAATLQPISIAAVNTAYTENFDGLVNSGTGDKTTLPTGFDFVETGTGATVNNLYTAGTGSLSTGDTYSFGSTGSTDRAFGTLQSGSVLPTIGAAYINNSGATITSLLISYTGEQWRVGFASRTVPDQLSFEYSTTATGISSGTFTAVPALDFISPISASTGAKDGNLAANKVAVSATITGLSIPVGATFYIRWLDVDANSSDDGLGVDDFSLIANPAVTCAAPTVQTATGVTNSTATVNFTGSASAVNGYTVTTVPVTTTQNLAAGATSVSFTNLSPSTAYTVNIVSKCAGGATSSAATTSFTTLPCTAPTATFNSTNASSVCSGSGTTLTGTLTGTAPFTGQYTVNGGAAQALSITGNTFSIATGNLTANATYTITALADATCTATTFPAPVTITVSPRPTATLVSSSPGTVCAGTSVTATTTLTGTAPYTVTVATTTPGGTTSLTGTVPGNVYPLTNTLTETTTYTITALTDANGCTAVAGTLPSITFNVVPLPTFTTAQTNVSCFGGSTGSITVTASNGTGSFEYSKDNGTTYQASNVFSGLAAATYAVRVRNLGGTQCAAASQSVTITQPASALAVSATKTDATTFGGTDGTVTATGNGGTSPYQYSINGGSTYLPATPTAASYTFTGLSAGSYTILVRDANGCTSSTTITVSSPGAPVCNAPTGLSATSVTQTSANASFTAGTGNTSFTATATPATGPVVTGTGTASPIALTGLAPNTTYTLRLQAVCSGGGTTAAVTTTFSTPAATCVAPGPPSFSTITTTSASVSFTPSGTNVGPYTVTATAGSSTITATGPASPISLTGLASGTTYSVTVTGTCTAAAGGGTSPASLAASLTTATPPCNAPTTPMPAGVTNSTATVNFTASGSATGYTVTTVPVTTTQTLGASATSVSFTGLSAGTAYTVNIVSNCAGGATSSAATTNFTTTSVCNAPTALVSSAITTNSATVSFMGSGSATGYTVTTSPVTSTQTLAAGATSVNLTGLSASTAYTVSIVSNCAGGANSSAATITVTTTAATLPNLIVTGGTMNVSGSYNNVTVTSTGQANLVGALTVTGALVIQTGGVLSQNCQLISGPGSFEIQQGALLGICDPAGIYPTGAGAVGAIRVTGTRTYSSGAAYAYNNPGLAAQVTGPGLPAQVGGLGVANTAGLTLSQPVAVAQQVTLQAGNLNTGGHTFTLLSSAAGTAVVDNGTLGSIVNGTTTVQRFIDNPNPIGYRHYSAPVSNTTLTDLVTNNFSPTYNPAYNGSPTPGLVTPFPTVFSYNEARVNSVASNYSPFDRGWMNPAAGAPMEVNRGYTVNAPNTALVDFVGLLNNGIQNSGPLAYSGPNAGWHLLGNPYPAPLDWSTLVPAVQLPGMEAAMHVFQSSGQYGGAYRTYTNGIGGGSPLITSASGYLVRVNTVGTVGAVNLTNGNRVTTFGAQPAFGRGTADTRPQLQLVLHGTTSRDETYVYFQAGATAGRDSFYDASKPLNPSGLNVSSLAGADALAINGLPLLSTAPVLVPLAVATPSAGSYSFEAANLANFAGIVTLIDALTNTRTVLATGTRYAFTLAGTTAPGRFTLEFRAAGALASTSAQALAAQIQLFPNPASASFRVQLPVLAGKAPVAATLVNALGQVVLSRTLSAPAGQAIDAEFDVRNLATGVYMLHLNVAGMPLVRKVVVE